MSQRPDMPLSASTKLAHAPGVSSESSAAEMLDVTGLERSGFAKAFAQQGVLVSGWWLPPAVVLGAAGWGFIIWWLL